MFDKVYLIKSISAVTNYNSSSCWRLTSICSLVWIPYNGNSKVIKTRTTFVVSNGRYTFYQIQFIKHNLTNTIYPILFIKYTLSNTIYQTPFIKYHLSNTFYQIPFIKYHLSNTVYQIPIIKYRLSNTIYQIPFAVKKFLMNESINQVFLERHICR